VGISSPPPLTSASALDRVFKTTHSRGLVFVSKFYMNSVFCFKELSEFLALPKTENIKKASVLTLAKSSGQARCACRWGGAEAPRS